MAAHTRDQAGRPAWSTQRGNLAIDDETLRTAILYLIAFVLSTTVHEFGHAWVATKLGDPMPRAQGRLTLSPVRHVDPIGTLLMPFLMVMASVPLIAWGKPVQTDPRAYTTRLSRSTGHMLVSIAGPFMNLFMAIAVSIVLIVGARLGVLSPELVQAGCKFMIQLNLVLMFLNLLPVHPLDGGAVLEWLLPPALQGVSDFMRRWGSLILIGALFIPGAFQTVLGPVYRLAGFWMGFVQQMAFR